PADDFFSLGGDSLSLVALVERIAQRLGVRLSLAEVLERPTLAGLTDLAAAGAAASDPVAPQTQPWLELRREGEATLFCFPDIVGRGLAFLPLASLIQGQRVLTIDYGGPDLAAQGLAAVLASGSREPLTLLGYSAGAAVALAVARALEALARPVRRLIFLDSYRPSPLLLGSPERRQELKEWIFAVLAGQANYPEELERQRARFDYCLQLAEGLAVNADIHLITAPDRQLSELFVDWSQSTTGQHLIHAGSGSHLEMLRFPFVTENHRILADIMDADRIGGKTCP
ncbi:MAG: thioesterase domain-containing protein, partial [Pseudomonadota bacterium]